MTKSIALRFDIDSIACVTRGLPSLMDLAKRFGISMTFFALMGKSVSYRSLLFKRNRNHSVKKSPLLHKMRLVEVLSTVVENPDVCRKYFTICERALSEGHELGLHGGRNHGWWQHHALESHRDELREDLSWGFDQFTKYFGKPKGFAPPGFVCDERTLEVIDALKFVYSSGLDGKEPFKPLVNGRRFEHWEIPVTVTGPSHLPFIEWMVIQGKSAEQIASGFSEELLRNSHVVLYGHPFFEGLKGIFALEKIVETALDRGYTFVKMQEMIPSQAETI